MLKYGSHINDGNWLQLPFTSCIDGYSCLRYWSVFFLGCVSGFRLKFPRIALLRKLLQLDSKSDSTTKELFLGFSVGKWLLLLTSDLYGLKFARNAQFLFFFDVIKFLRCLIWGVFWSVLQKVLYFLGIVYCNFNWQALGFQCNFNFFLFVSFSFFSEVVLKIFDYFWKSNSLFSKFSVNCLLMFYFVYFNKCDLEDANGAC